MFVLTKFGKFGVGVGGRHATQLSLTQGHVVLFKSDNKHVSFLKSQPFKEVFADIFPLHF